MTDLNEPARPEEALARALDWLETECRPDADWAGEGHNFNMSARDREKGVALIAALRALAARLTEEPR
jgi:hypothetical protein